MNTSHLGQSVQCALRPLLQDTFPHQAVAREGHEGIPLQHSEAVRQLADCFHEASDSGANAVAIRPAKIDRSTCGTGCLARLAVLHAKEFLRVNDVFVGRSIIGSRFDCRIEAEAVIGRRPGIVASIAGRAWATGMSQLALDPANPWPTGYRLNDTWPVWQPG